ncbi:MAG TPA: PLP-dependent aminotransferase family protein [Thermoanaerobaculia bacterium]|jgi:GntR family transcriptional regulator/MocR family aminotransferase|nr:PLP-dependent aminotransferase family protein [Thermoanaerobaculia bacterium]
MPKETWKLALPFLRIDRSRGALEQQLYRQMRSAITDGRLPAGLRMPSSRQFAIDLGVSRNTVLAVFERLTSEGLLQSRTGSGTFVAAVRAPRVENTTPLPLSSWAEEVEGMDEWRNAAPAPDLFPAERWAQYVSAQWRHRSLSPKSDPRGDAGLRLAIADHVAPMSGIVCEPDNVLITSGLQQALDCIARALIDPGDAVLVEDPLNPLVRRSLQTARAELVANRTDAEGMLPEFLDLTARLAYVSASSQNPMGAALSASRQFLLIEWAKKNGVVVIENADAAGIDTAARESSLKMIDTRGVVLSIGSFETTLSPEVGIGYIIGTQTKITQLAKVRSSYGTLPPAPEQRALKEFLTRGDFAAHLKRQRQVYMERYEAFAREIQTHLGGRIVGVTKSAALRLIVWLAPDADESTLADAFHAVGLRCRPMSALTIANPLSPAVLVDYGTIAAETAPVLAQEIANQLRPATGHPTPRAGREEPRRGEDRVA